MIRDRNPAVLPPANLLKPSGFAGIATAGDFVPPIRSFMPPGFALATALVNRSTALAARPAFSLVKTPSAAHPRLPDPVDTAAQITGTPPDA